MKEKVFVKEEEKPQEAGMKDFVLGVSLNLNLMLIDNIHVNPLQQKLFFSVQIDPASYI